SRHAQVRNRPGEAAAITQRSRRSYALFRSVLFFALHTTVADVVRDVITALHKKCFTGRISATKITLRSLEKRDNKAANRAIPDFPTTLQTKAVVEKQDIFAETTKCTHEKILVLVLEIFGS